ncbi:acylamino-acid-releasing enzyme-like isoform X2 [Stegodyphus dumicola]|uniref:acylamino-acid-releasing enzyme-like isoform X2 n=1 Tax=Stegodyphus dumicola TaxID=202533 RepID=UPI0015B2799A|nr:acylamino-acid-releasing enzyme-like isoform X2 [Stegodyphus dumicola]
MDDQIWNLSRKEKTFDLSERKEHGKIYDNMFGCLSWSADEKYLLYIAEKKQKKSVSYFKDCFCQDSGGSDKDDKDTVKGEEYLYREDWGEDLVGLHDSVICILELETGKIEVIELSGKYENLWVTQAVWGPKDEFILFVGYDKLSRRLGIQYCAQRRSGIYSVNKENKEIECISIGNSVSVRSPRFSPAYNYLIYLENEAGGPHRMCNKLTKYDWNSKTHSTVIDVVEKADDDSFPGLYIEKLPKRCWTGNGKYIIFSSPWKSSEVILCVDVKSLKVQKIKIDETLGACHVLDVFDNFVVASVSSPDLEPCLALGYLEIDEDISVTWIYLNNSTPAKIPGIKWDVISLTPTVPNAKYPFLKYEVILISPEEIDDKSPLIIWPHGGPHSVFLCSFMVFVAAFVKLGYVVGLVNYRGSLGYGDSSVRSLLGNIGTQDVQDVQHAAEYLKNKSELKISDVVLFGGSHGGFLTAHLCGQYPDFYKAAVCRNPVIDISGKVEATDIPDWAWVETGQEQKFNLSAVVDPDVLKCMWEKSPIKYIKNVSAPTLLLVGKKDLRVPPSQAFKYYHLLKAQNVPVQVFCYDDNHGLSKVTSSSDGFMQTVLWFKKHL